MDAPHGSVQGGVIVAKVEFFFDCSSPWTYLAFHNFQAIALELKPETRYRPILVGGIFNTVNPSVYAMREAPVPAKDAYQTKDLGDWARYSGIAIKWRPSIFPINSVRAMRGCIVADQAGVVMPYARLVFEAYWRDDRDITQDGVLAEIARGAGLDPGAHLAEIDRPEIKQRLRDNTDELVRRGGFGSPTMFVNGGDMYFGNDRLPLVGDAIMRASG
jgi:2-hydroxychromene-2-carboxylate isomerase